MVDQQRARGRRFGRGVELRAPCEGFQEARDVLVEFADFADYGVDEVGLVGGQGGEGLRAFGVLDLNEG